MDPCRLYLISPPEINDVKKFAVTVDEAFSAGDVACFQLRLKDRQGNSAPDDAIVDCARVLLPIAQAYEVAFLINDRPDLAKRVGADGVHLGQSDGSVQMARDVLGADASIGVTCHNSKALGFEAGERGADYAAFGAFFPTTTKETKYTATPALLEAWSFSTTMPSVAIGGITPENCGALIVAGADFLAVSSAVWEHPDGAGVAVKAFNQAIAEHGRAT